MHMFGQVFLTDRAPFEQLKTFSSAIVAVEFHSSFKTFLHGIANTIVARLYYILVGHYISSV